MPKVVEVVPIVVEVLVEDAPKAMEVVVEIVLKVLAGCAKGAWRLYRR